VTKVRQDRHSGAPRSGEPGIHIPEACAARFVPEITELAGEMIRGELVVRRQPPPASNVVPLCPQRRRFVLSPASDGGVLLFQRRRSVSPAISPLDG
jgi:hypothetical protein